MSSEQHSPRARFETPSYDRSGDDGEISVQSAADKAYGRRLRNWIILANLGAWIVILLALKWLIF
jgi:hypothetical protein